MIQTLPISKVRQELPELVENAKVKLNEYIITVNGVPSAVLISSEEYESWKETMEIMGDSSLMASIEQGLKDLAQGETITLEELEASLHV